MELPVWEDVLAVRLGRTSREVVAVDDDISTEEKESICSIGIEHLLTLACIKQVRAHPSCSNHHCMLLV